MIKGIVLSPLSITYAAVTRLRTAAYKSGLLKTTRLPLPVISIGNITVGGTGKTPLVARVSRALAAEGRKVCVLTRGYARENASERIVVSDGSAMLASVEQAGDEPLWLAENLKGVAAVICDPDRAAAGRWAIDNLKSDAFVLDDGFQHLQLGRDLDIVVIDATNPWGGGHLLPHGRLREGARGLSRADCVIITRMEQNADISSLKSEIQKLLGDHPILTSQMQTKGVRELNGQCLATLGLIPQPVVAFCGIGNPDSFFSQLRSGGLNITTTQAFPDHHQYKPEEIVKLSDKARRLNASSLITTAKDAVKLRDFKFDLSCYVLDIEISIDQQDKLQDLIRTAIRSR
jgi:tetraacyldisaccharide 4'-kinase